MTALSLPDPASTEALGARLAALLAPRDVVFLRGDLGAGKTTLARGLIGAWTGADEEAPSPNLYAGADL
ncbi:MAG: tRNA (adenosine(37)-N6)-threonylcarbamoyltransferase complex ATPase subunit type 1 TsaE [Alphaproteobacteria bacterium]